MRTDNLTKQQRESLAETFQHHADLIREGHRVDDFIISYQTIDTGEIALAFDTDPDNIEYRKLGPATFKINIDLTYSPDEKVEGCNPNLNNVE